MLLFRILNYLSGYRELSCSPERVRIVINRIASNQLDYWGMRREKGGELRFSMLNREYRRFRSLAEEGEGELLRVEREAGLPRLIRRYRKRLGIPIGLLLFLMLAKLSTMYVWEVTVSGNDRISDGEVIESLGELGCSVGSYIPSIDFYSICHEFILSNDEVSWISVNMIGTTAQVEIIERRGKDGMEEEGNGTPTNLIAAREGVVVRVETASGETLVSAGETVGKGQLLINGVVGVGPEEEGRFVLVRSRGKVYAETERTLQIAVPLKSVKKTYSGRDERYKYVKFFGKIIKLKENSSILPEGCDIIEDKKRLILFEGDRITGGIALPVSVITGYCERYDETEVTLTPEEALAEAQLRMAQLFAEQLPDAEVLTRRVSSRIREGEDGRVLLLEWQLRCIENIAEEVPIGIS